ncbi:unnamed protein product [Cercopithifilaria johnstoni]|uniref:Uncharacterized protein n=1 Tax=Cercopithifilaria johnstoni TaxID=2874296 RepID=A0A8J2Q624_9BILA|nr:unnamed protein product [Cercopithifilaria johnstoni]
MLDLKLFCTKIPKCEFNVRWEACVGKSALRTLLEYRRLAGKAELTNEQRKLLWAYGHPRDMKEALQSMSIIYDLVVLQEHIFMITLDIINYYNADNVLYLELHVKPYMIDELSPEILLRKMIQAISFSKAEHGDMIIKILLIAELEESIEKVRDVIDLLLIFGKTHRNQNLPDSDIINGVEIVFVNSNENVMYQLQKIIEFIRRESDLTIVFNLAKMSYNFNLLHNILLLHPDRLCNAEILSESENQIDQHILIDRLLSMKLPIEFSYTVNRLSYTEDKKFIWRKYLHYLFSIQYPIILTTGYSMLLGCNLSDEYYQLATTMNLKPSDIYKLSLTTSFFTEKTPRIHRHNLFPFGQQYDEFAKLYKQENSIDFKLEILRNCQFFLSRPLNCKHKRRRRHIIDILYF